VLNESLSVAQHLDYFRAAYRLTDLGYADNLIDRLAYRQYYDTPIRELSGGTQQKLNLTLALMHRPAVLLLDEPYQGFDWETYLHFWELAGELRTQGCCLIVISHLLFEQERFDVIYQLRRGQLQLDTGGASGSTSLREGNG
jgi:ABC-type multidrug transport system ATPase subunit